MDIQLFVNNCRKPCELLEIIIKNVVSKKHKLTIFGTSLNEHQRKLIPDFESVYVLDPDEIKKHKVLAPACIINGEVIFFGVVGRELLFEVLRIISDLSSEELERVIAVTGYNY